MKPLLVATDLDGTLVRSDRTISDYTAGVLKELDAAGVPVVFVTGRPLRWAEPVFPYVGSHGLAICSNGALVWDVTGGGARLERVLAGDVALQVAERIREAVPGTVFGADNIDGFAIERDWVDEFKRIPQPPRRGLRDLLSAPIYKLIGRHHEVGPDEFARAATEAVGDLVTVTHSTSNISMVEISALGVTKATTLAKVAAGLGIGPEQVIAFGDMPNDVAMLSWAGASYAMADAHPEVRACAKNVAPGHDEDGVARVLAEVFELS